MAVDHLAEIVARKRLEVARRARRAPALRALAARVSPPAPSPVAALRRPQGALPRVIAEIKMRSPSAGQIRPREVGALPVIAAAYEAAGAAAVSVLVDGPGFGGCPLDLRRVAARVELPVLFKEFVLDPVQVALARACGASMVLLLVRALEQAQLEELVAAVQEAGLEPVVEAADASELERALRSAAPIVGVNARDLRSFDVDGAAAARLVEQIPAERVAVFMSGVRSAAELRRLATGRADAVLVGEGLMRASDPGARLASWLAEGA